MTGHFRTGLIALIIICTIGIVGGFLWIRTSLPQTTGTVEFAKLANPVEIFRGKHGVPHIFSQSEEDAAFALGFIHGQDRLWQMEFTRRVGAGRLSEIIGEETLETDRFLRVLGLYRLAEAQAAALSGGAKSVLDAYVDGVNAFIENHRGAWPIEYLLLGFTPEKWTAADSLVWAKLMGLRLSPGWRGDLLRAKLADKIGVEALRRLFPRAALQLPDRRVLNDRSSLAAIGDQWPNLLKAESASNAWVVAGTRTKSGKPILANDPHLGFASPGLWYPVRITAGSRTRIGATVPGVPLMVLGQNDKLAWGLTSAGADTSDLFVEVLDGSNVDQYLTPNGPKRFRVREEIIRIKGGDQTTIVIRESRHGPILSDIMPSLKSITSKRNVVALSATILKPGDRTVEGLYRINHSETLEEFQSSARLFDAPLQNLFAADTKGGIGFVSAGKMPIRPKGTGHLPLLGVHGRHDWNGYLAAKNWPQSWNPSSGYLANANNEVQPKENNSVFQYAEFWPETHRISRIHEYFRASSNHGVSDSMRLQMDNRTVAAKTLIPVLTKISPKSARARNAIRLLRKWDFQMDRSRTEPLIYATWVQHLMTTLVADELAETFSHFAQPRPQFIHRTLTVDPAWCDDVLTAETESCPSRIERALKAALSELESKYGEDQAEWTWGEAHTAVFAHPILRQVPVLGAWVEGKVETDGGDHTLNRGQSGRLKNDPHRHSHGAGFRAVYDLSNMWNSRFSLATGQSGNPLSPNYMNLLTHWRDGEYFSFTRSRDELKDQGSERLLLQPISANESDRNG